MFFIYSLAISLSRVRMSHIGSYTRSEDCLISDGPPLLEDRLRFCLRLEVCLQNSGSLHAKCQYHGCCTWPSKWPDGGVSMSSLICLAKGQEHVWSSRIGKMAGAWLSYHDQTNGGGSVVALLCLQKGPSKATLIDLIGLMSEAFLPWQNWQKWREYGCTDLQFHFHWCYLILLGWFFLLGLNKKNLIWIY